MDDLKPKVKELIIRRLNLKVPAAQIIDDEPIFGASEGGLGLDSIDALDLVVGIFEEFGVEIQQSDMQVFESITKLSSFVGNRLAAKTATPA